MALQTTTIGAYPKPDYVKIDDWFTLGGMETSKTIEDYEDNVARMGAKAEEVFRRAAAEVIADQVSCGIDIPTDGEVRRENYIHYHCRYLAGFDFEKLQTRNLRQGALTVDLPAVVGPITAGAPFLPDDWRASQATTDKPVKVTLPGPMTIVDTTADLYYDDEETEGRDLAAALNSEILALAEAGCRHIQIDEPLFARYPQKALKFGIANLDRCWENIPASVVRTAHICCGYPNYLDQQDYMKADRHAYLEIAEAMDASRTQAISLEDAHRHNDLGLLDCFKESTILLGLVKIASSQLETVDEVRDRLTAALVHIPSERLMAAPDCGLGYLGRELAMTKLRVLCEAAQSI